MSATLSNRKQGSNMPNTDVVLRTIQTPYSKSYALIFPDTDESLGLIWEIGKLLQQEGFTDKILAQVEIQRIYRSTGKDFVPAYPIVATKAKRQTKTKPTPRVRRTAPGER